MSWTRSAKRHQIAWRLGALLESPTRLPCAILDTEKKLKYSSTQQECLEELILPAFEAALKIIDLSSILSGRLEFQNLPPQHVGLPHTVDRGPEKPVLIAMNWTGSSDDVICLAHEVGHALQLLLSRDSACTVARKITILNHGRRHTNCYGHLSVAVQRSRTRRSLDGVRVDPTRVEMRGSLFCNDWITPYDNIRDIVHGITYTLFPNHAATSLSRHQDGSVRKITRWTDVNLRRANEQVLA